MKFDKFLRYTIPGLVTLIIFFLLASLTDIENTEKIIDFKISIGYIAGVIVVAGGLGAIFNIIYWAIFHLVYYPLDHTKLISSLSDKLKIIDANGKVKSNISKREAWSIFNTYWYSKTNLRNRFEAINPRVDRLSDVTHGLGTILIGLIVVYVFWCVFYINSESSWIGPALLGFAFIILTFLNYIFSRNIYQNVLNTTFASVLNEDLAQLKKEDSSITQIEITFIK